MGWSFPADLPKLEVRQGHLSDLPHKLRPALKPGEGLLGLCQAVAEDAFLYHGQGLGAESNLSAEPVLPT